MSTTVDLPGIGTYTFNAEGIIDIPNIKVKSNAMMGFNFAFSIEYMKNAREFYVSIRTILAHRGIPYIRRVPGLHYVLMTNWSVVKEYQRHRPGDSDLNENRLFPEMGHRLVNIVGTTDVRVMLADQGVPRYLSTTILCQWAAKGLFPKLPDVWCCVVGDRSVELNPAELVPDKAIAYQLANRQGGGWPVATSITVTNRKEQVTQDMMRSFQGKRPRAKSAEAKAASGRIGRASATPMTAMGPPRQARDSFSVTTPGPSAGPSSRSITDVSSERLSSRTPRPISIPATSNPTGSSRSASTARTLPTPDTPNKRQRQSSGNDDRSFDRTRGAVGGDVRVKGGSHNELREYGHGGTPGSSRPTKGKGGEPPLERNETTERFGHGKVDGGGGADFGTFLRRSRMTVFLGDGVPKMIRERVIALNVPQRPLEEAFVIVIDARYTSRDRLTQYRLTLETRHGVGVLVDAAWLEKCIENNAYCFPDDYVVESHCFPDDWVIEMVGDDDE